MTCLPFNNLDEHLARFAATKKSSTTNQNTNNIKQFTFKKSLSLGRNSSSRTTVPALQSSENTRINSNSCQLLSTKSNQDPIKPVKKQGVITNFFSQSDNASKKTDFNKETNKNLNTSFLKDDFFLDDLNDFDIPSSRNENDNKNAKIIQENKSITENEKKPLFKSVLPSCPQTFEKDSNTEKENLISGNKKYSTETCSTNSGFSEQENVSQFKQNSQNFDFIELVDLEACTELSFSDEEVKPVFTKKRKSRRLLSDDEDDQSANIFVSQDQILKSEDKSIDESKQNEYSANTDAVLNSLQKMNVEIMTEICDLIQDEKLHFQNEDLNILLMKRKKLLQNMETVKKDPNSPTSKSLEWNDIPKFLPVQKLKPGLLFESKKCTVTSNNSHNTFQSENIRNSFTSLISSSPKNQTLNNNKSEAMFDSSSKTSYQNKFLLNENLEQRPEFKSHNLDQETNTSIHIENIETQNLIENSIYDISDDELSTVSEKKILETDPERIVAGKFYGNQKDDGASLDFKGFNFAFSIDVLNVFQNVFGLKQFRHNQLETINAALLKEDCFVLMPTGGGKSLCYQLPSLVNSGVTIVVSPLRSLIMDQVQKLNSLDIPAYCLTGDTDSSTSNYIYHQLASREPNIKLLYVTPEKISASAKLVSCLENLYARSMIQRFVIDEAHCVSQWGHDFRPDYKKLKVLREKFPNVPMMALTATATQRVRLDILHQLGIPSPKWFLQSFNRPNLKYEIRPKTKNVVQDIIKLIHTKFKNMCGIIYCLSRNDCDALAENLQKNGIKASAYHAGMNNRDEVQESWINDKFKVICATIAFGMGIDKPDVRFVIHHAIPKSIEGYYQESGRAGRDGEHSWCILFYSYKDTQRFKRMIMKDDANKHSWATHFDNLYRMVYYCENKTDCRRVWMLGYFGEIFDKQLCLSDPQTACDNCFSKEVFENCDVTNDAIAVIQCVSKIVDHRRGKNYTLPYLVDIYRGAKTKKILAAGHDKLELHGKGQHVNRSDAERLLRKLVLDQYLHEDLYINKMDLAITYIYLGKRAKELLSGKVKIIMPFHKGVKNKKQLPVATSTPDKETLQLIEKCYNELIEISKLIANERKMHYTNVINVEALRQMSREMPMTEEDMLTIPHITRAVYEKYGKRFLDVTARYAAERCVIDAEKADNEMLSALTEDIDNWSDAEPPSMKSTTTRRGQKRKRPVQGGKTKKQKNNFCKKKWQKTKANTKKSSVQASNKTNKGSTIKPTQTSRLPGFLPLPKCSAKPVIRSFLQTPRVTLM